MRRIQLTNGGFALVDDEDFELVSKFRWRRFEKVPGYFCPKTTGWRCGKRFTFEMGRLVMGHPKGLCVDHKNGNPMDNRRCNLRLATPGQNGANRHTRTGTSKFHGVHWSKRAKKWRAQVRVNGKSYHLGQFVDELEAAKAYDAAASKHFGEFANLNFPEATSSET